jgi:hypothetical protein
VQNTGIFRILFSCSSASAVNDTYFLIGRKRLFLQLAPFHAGLG